MTAIKSQSLSDAELAARVANGDNRAFDLLTLRYQDALQRFLVSLTKNYDSAWDLLQEALIRALNFIRNGGFRLDGNFHSWLWRIANNLFRDHCRRAKTHKETSIDQPTDTDAPEGGNSIGRILPSTLDNGIAAKNREKVFSYIENLVDNLPESQKSVIKARLDGEKTQAIADRLGCSINTVLGRIHDVKKKLTEAVLSNSEVLDAYCVGWTSSESVVYCPIWAACESDAA